MIQGIIKGRPEARARCQGGAYRIILADDHPVARSMFKKILLDTGELEVIAEAADGQEFLKLLEKSVPDMAILDIRMPKMSGLEAAKEVKARHPDVKVLILTMHKDKEYLMRALEVGAEGYVLKEDVDQVLLSAIKAIRQGKIFISPLRGD